MDTLKMITGASVLISIILLSVAMVKLNKSKAKPKSSMRAVQNVGAAICATKFGKCGSNGKYMACCDPLQKCHVGSDGNGICVSS